MATVHCPPLGGIDARGSSAAAGARRVVDGVFGVIKEMDEERTVTRGDHVAFGSSPPKVQSIDLGTVSAAEVDQMAERGLIVDLEMFSREP